MMENVEKKIAELQAKIERLKAELQPLIERGERGESYWVIDSTNTVVYTEECNGEYDQARYDAFNYYTDETLCKRVAEYYKRTALFTRKAIEFAQGYRFEADRRNSYVSFSCGDCVYKVYSNIYLETPLTIYMKETQAYKFKEWCNENNESLRVCAL